MISGDGIEIRAYRFQHMNRALGELRLTPGSTLFLSLGLWLVRQITMFIHVGRNIQFGMYTYVCMFLVQGCHGGVARGWQPTDHIHGKHTNNDFEIKPYTESVHIYIYTQAVT